LRKDGIEATVTKGMGKVKPQGLPSRLQQLILKKNDLTLMVMRRERALSEQWQKKELMATM
jgi:hypothetical protein